MSHGQWQWLHNKWTTHNVRAYNTIEVESAGDDEVEPNVPTMESLSPEVQQMIMTLAKDTLGQHDASL